MTDELFPIEKTTVPVGEPMTFAELINDLMTRPGAAERDAAARADAIREAIEATVDAELIERRRSCWCGRTRKPCEYHSGVEAGTELALDAVWTQR